jgi:molybdopterin-guanine dinucleotide biosynthesis protein MobB
MTRRRAVAFIGYSNSGKTTLIRRLVEHFTARACSVAVAKHTHHILRGHPGGDTDKFLDSGAIVTVLAGNTEAIVTRPHGERERITYGDPRALVDALAADYVLIEGWKGRTDWPRIVVDREEAERLEFDVATVKAIVTDRDVDLGIPRFRHDDIAGIADFVDTISRQ